MTNGTGAAADFYSSLWEIRDRRMDDWPMMASPLPTVALSTTYVILVTLVGPAIMKNREPFQLKGPIQVYNVAQVAVSAYIVYEAFMAGWGTHYSWLCQNVEDDTDGNGMRMARIVWVYYISKFFEFFDTFFFIARKKFTHVSALQVIHHGIMPVYSYAQCRWLPGGQETFGGFMNSIVHVIMYSYYFLAALGPHIQPYLWWKRYLTSFQMLQFGMVFVKSLVIITGLGKCGYPWQFSLITMVLMVLFFGLFADFYAKEYKKKKSAPRSSDKGVKNGSSSRKTD